MNNNIHKIYNSRIEKTVHEIRKNILNGTHEHGSKLIISQLKEKYFCSSSVVREALSLLTSESLVFIKSQRGFYVKILNFNDYKDILDSRFTIEKNALELSICSKNKEWKEKLYKSLEDSNALLKKSALEC